MTKDFKGLNTMKIRHIGHDYILILQLFWDLRNAHCGLLILFLKYCN